MTIKLKKKSAFPGLLILILGIGFVVYMFSRLPENESTTQKKSAHFLDSTPLHGEVYAASPINVTINFDFDLAQGSTISVTKDSIDWSTGEVRIENNKTALKKDLKGDLPDGNYLVKYKACWPDKSCHDGQFTFKINSALKSQYEDMTGKTEVQVDMKDIRFVSPKILISPGTKVIWTNSDTVDHFVNTETHPAHTYFLEQNSRSIASGQTYSTIFTTPGQYNYHCSAHAVNMTASLIVVSE